jgi:fucokinase
MNMIDIENIQTRFLAQSYSNALKNYQFLLQNPDTPTWDYIVITASNKQQADYFLRQISDRQQQGLVPSSPHYLVVPDVNDQRIGSGGATLNALLELRRLDPLFFDKKTLLIHSGGDSKRIPQYSSCGKLFSPTPHILKSTFRSTLFDELLMTLQGVASRIPSGLLVAPGDTELMFNPLQIDCDGCDGLAISLKASADIGKEHGVFLKNADGFVSAFLHKFSEEELNKKGAVDSNGDVFLDTGYVWLSASVTQKMFSLLDSEGQDFSARKQLFINDQVRLNFYADFLYPLSRDGCLEEFQKETPEGIFSDQLSTCRQILWEALHGYRMKIVQLEPAKYITIGTSQELFSLMTREIQSYSNLGWTPNVLSYPYKTNFSSSLSLIQNSSVPSNCYIEDSNISDSQIGANSIISSCDFAGKSIPSDIVLHTLKLVDGCFVTRIYGLHDNPKSTIDGPFLGSSIRKLSSILHLSLSDLSSSGTKTIWNSAIYAAGNDANVSIDLALILYKAANGFSLSKVEMDEYSRAKKYSLETSFALADVSFLTQRQKTLCDQIITLSLVEEISSSKPFSEIISAQDFSFFEPSLPYLYEITKDEQKPYLLRSRILLFISLLLKKEDRCFLHKDWHFYENACFAVISSSVEQAHWATFPPLNRRLSPCVKTLTVSLPVRVNFCGSPSDAAPYCLEHGGTELNAAILLSHERPIKVTIERLSQPCIIVKSLDLGIEERINSLDKIERLNPNSFSNLYVACFRASGLFTIKKHLSFSAFIDSIGGGFRITTSVRVPKGSGLGTSSLLIACILKALGSFYGTDFSDQQIYSQVFLTEQLMTTGGGWQDQVGGLTPGFKLITTFPGPHQTINFDLIRLSSETKDELSKRFALIFSGQRRLAKGVLRQEMMNLFANGQEANDAAKRVQELSAIMKMDLERGDVDSFAERITEQFSLVQRLDSGASNDCIDFIFESCKDLLSGYSICGAGGGGFLMVILKKYVSKKDLEERINSVFRGCGVSVWDSEFLW